MPTPRPPPMRTSGRLPDFLVIGAQKAGTTSLYAYLRRHPGVWLPQLKEGHYFDWELQRGIEWYRSVFADAADGQLVGEASPFYLFHPGVPARVAEVLPNARLLVMVRDPVERALSHYHWERRFGGEDRTPRDAFTTEMQTIDVPLDETAYDDRDGSASHRTYLRRGLYAEQLERWYARVRREQLLVVETNELTRGGGLGDGYARILDFLGLTRMEPPDREFNTQKYPEIDGDLRDELARFFAPHNARLFELLGGTLRLDPACVAGGAAPPSGVATVVVDASRSRGFHRDAHRAQPAHPAGLRP